MKKCSKCGKTKPLSEFNKDKNRKDGLYPQCKKCKGEYQKDHKEEHNTRNRKYYHSGGREEQGYQSMYKNKLSPQYLGIVVAERLVKHLYPDVKMMPYGFPGYDLICRKLKRINVKASTIHKQYNKYSTVNYWKFSIKYNKNCDYFLCLAFDNIEDCNPLMAWLIPGNEINKNASKTISSTTIHKWDKWRMDVNDAQSCCTVMKGGK